MKKLTFATNEKGFRYIFFAPVVSRPYMTSVMGHNYK